MALEKEDLSWKSSLFQLKSGTLKFMVNASIDTLPTSANWKRWTYTFAEKCRLYGNRATTIHNLNCCSTMLNIKRYTWRHNILINFIVNNVDEKFKVFSDLLGWEAPGGGTMPQTCVLPNSNQVFSLLTPAVRNYNFLWLTCPLTMNIRIRKSPKSMLHLCPI